MAPRWNTGASAEEELPEYAGHYRLESCLGSGGMGVVHLARSTSGLKLAVKVVHAEFAKDREFRGRFRQEVAAARRVSGAFTAPVVDADPEADRPWMATLFIPGPTLSEYVKQNGPMPPAQLRRLMAGLAEALRDIHRVGVVHRDLKPSNVLLAEDGPKVIDFGISRPKDSELRTETGKLIGTPPFMAPEQFRRPREVGPAADIFALGSVLVHAATGRGPFDSDSPYVVAYQVVHDEPDLTGVPENLAPLVLRCLAKEPEDRPTPDELMRELRSVSASYDTQAFIPAQRSDDRPKPDPVVPPAVRPRRRRLSRRAALSIGALGLVLAGALASVVWLLSDSGPMPKATGAQGAPNRFAGWQTRPGDGGSGTPQCTYGAGYLICSRTGSVFALDPADGTVLWKRSVAKTHWSGPPIVSGGLVQFKADGQRHVEALDPVSGRTQWQRDLPENNETVYAGNMLLLRRPDGTVTGVDSASGHTEWTERIPGHGQLHIHYFSGDSLAYATSTSNDGASTHVTAVDPASGALRWDTRLKGLLEPVGARAGSVYLLAADPVYLDTNAVVRYDAKSGTAHRVQLPAPRHDAQAAVRGNVVFLLGADGALDGVDTGAGKRAWHVDTSVSRGSAPVADDRHVYLTAADGRLLAVNARDGRPIGQTPPRRGASGDRVTAVLPAPVIAHNHVYATAPDGTVFAVDARDPSDW
ncbi:protein kinase domain-containing protein [Streptomyces brasiliensis]|uniref:Serine/threonine protein kinase n=1 Tax=Streptomyces brasiliensis TaxID=1954 RepID=A0A917L5L4_9ACTN|nr:PQQ-binding-like beta-propeller repeat protein [Streptomyces brasiliensis]GGJ46083.1 serine/threonine protein kinase [Streptomyces brasiliensis]